MPQSKENVHKGIIYIHCQAFRANGGVSLTFRKETNLTPYFSLFQSFNNLGVEEGSMVHFDLFALLMESYLWSVTFYRRASGYYFWDQSILETAIRIVWYFWDPVSPTSFSRLFLFFSKEDEWQRLIIGHREAVHSPPCNATMYLTHIHISQHFS